MRFNRKSLKFENPYKLNEKTKNYIINIAMDDYMEFFHEWDSASFRTRDIHPELAEYLDLCSEDIPLKKRIELNFNVQNSTPDEAKETKIRASFRNFYTFLFRVEERTIREQLLRALFLVLASTAFIFLYFFLRKMMTFTRIWQDVLVEGLMIGGWVFMWEAVHIVTFQLNETRKRRKEIERFLKAPLLFTYRTLTSL